MPSVGSYLRGLRQRRGVSLDEISRSTRIPQRYLEALEGDDFAPLPAPPPGPAAGAAPHPAGPRHARPRRGDGRRVVVPARRAHIGVDVGASAHGGWTNERREHPGRRDPRVGLEPSVRPQHRERGGRHPRAERPPAAAAGPERSGDRAACRSHGGSVTFLSGLRDRLREGLKRSQEHLASGLAAGLRGSGKQVLLAAADTFRAAAIEQLQRWGERIDVAVIHQAPGSDPAAVVFDAVKAATARGVDALIVDTAGRLHTKTNLMEELAKLKRVIERQLPGAPHESLMVMDAPTGQNGFAQARMFHEAIGLSGVALTKLDGTAKGGIVVRIVRELKVPIKLVGVGERVDDLQAFDAEAFVDALLPVK